ncbi:MAG: 2OG-Fe(II) oxygenase, partial [Thermoflexales bacterium]
GRVYRMAPGEGHFDSWHGDVGQGRQIALSINLGSADYEGGLLQLARSDSDSSDLLAEIANTGAGDALVFRIAPWLRHRVTDIAGTVAKTAYAGWFRTYPDFQTLWHAHFDQESGGGSPLNRI